jgi:hypothetical protein
MSAKFHPAETSGGQVVEGFLSGGNVNYIEAVPELVRDVVDGNGTEFFEVRK